MLQEGWDAGEGIEKLARRVRDVFDRADRYRSFVIARTETTAAANMAQIAVMEQAGVEYKQWLTGRDERVCPLCGSLDGKVVRIDEEFTPGVFAPPAHPSCRCTVLSASGPEPITKYPGQPRDEKGRFAPGKMRVRVKSPGKRATEAQKRTMEVLDSIGHEKLAELLEECKTYSMPDRAARKHLDRHSEVGAASVQEYVRQARNVVSNPDKIYAVADDRGLGFAFAAGVRTSKWRVSICSVPEKRIKSYYGPRNKREENFWRVVGEKSHQGWVEVEWQ